MEVIIELAIVFGFGAVFVTLFFFLFQILRLKLKKLKREFAEEKELSQVDVLKKDIGYLMAENEEMKEELRNIKYLLSGEISKQAIDLKAYEKQQIEIDKRNKFEL
ncbi:hypothetical protein [Aureispira sp. CCB-QB1]|uniref:hypothetical protein n=1 Tax=Aureispira sp. CCB-QB1 TaxID=1313421 RepID=UPI0006986F5D|nr:hypothetical protein [Aureispira sp. CCB-QB1]